MQLIPYLLLLKIQTLVGVATNSANKNNDVTKYFKTKLGSKEGLTISKPVEDHYIQRTKAIKFIFNKLEENPQMKTSEFLRILKKYCKCFLEE